MLIIVIAALIVKATKNGPDDGGEFGEGVIYPPDDPEKERDQVHPNAL